MLYHLESEIMATASTTSSNETFYSPATSGMTDRGIDPTSIESLMTNENLPDPAWLNAGPPRYSPP